MRNGTIEIYRFLLCWTIVVGHFVLWKGGPSFWNSFMAVDVFFILSGYFMMAHLSTQILTGSVWRDTKSFMVHKWTRLYGIFFICFLTDFFIRICFPFGKFVPPDMITRLAQSIVKLSLSEVWGIPTFSDSFWFMSALFWGTGILVPLLLKFRTIMLTWVSPLIVVVSLFVLFSSSGSLGAAQQPIFLSVQKGLLLALVGLLIGVWCFCLSKQIAQISCSYAERWWLSLLEIICYIESLYCIIDTYSKWVLLAVYWSSFIAIAITMSGKSLWSGKLDGKLASVLGMSSFFIYLSHGYWGELMRLHTFPYLNIMTGGKWYLLLTIATTLLNIFLVIIGRAVFVRIFKK